MSQNNHAISDATANPVPAPLFTPKKTVATFGVQNFFLGLFECSSEEDEESALECINEFYALLFSRHISGDWGSCCKDDSAQNDRNCKSGEGFLMSVFEVAGQSIWLITEHDRSVCTILLPSEY
jgi:hypothetical protein